MAGQLHNMRSDAKPAPLRVLCFGALSGTSAHFALSKRRGCGACSRCAQADDRPFGIPPGPWPIPPPARYPVLTNSSLPPCFDICLCTCVIYSKVSPIFHQNFSKIPGMTVNLFGESVFWYDRSIFVSLLVPCFGQHACQS